MIGYGIREVRRTRQVQRCRNNLKQIGFALHAYHHRYAAFPPAYIVGPDGMRWHSWRVLLLPFLEQTELYNQYKFDEPWNGPHNQALASSSPDVYTCERAANRLSGVTTFLAVVGRATAWPEEHSAKLDDFHDGTSTTIQLVECASSDILWSEPRDMTHQDAMRFDQPGSGRIPASAHEVGSAFLTLMADGTVRWIRPQIARDTFRSLLSPHGGAPLAGVDWPPIAIPDAVDLPMVRAAAEFPGTDVWPYPDAPITRGRNAVYCATFALASQAACDQCNGRPLQLDGDPPLARGLNAFEFQRSNLADDSCVVGAGPGIAAFRDQLEAEVTRKFPKSSPKLVNLDARDHVLQLYAYLQKSLAFQVAFESIEKPLVFPVDGKNQSAASFGMLKLSDDWRADQIRTQVTILDYVSDDDFILSLKPARDLIVLAKVPLETTLQATIATVTNRIAKPDPRHTDQHFLATESLAVPKLTLSIEREYSEIIDLRIIGTDLEITGAKQIIKFRLDEIGAVLESEAAVVGDNGHTPHFPAGKRSFLFNRPFLIYLIERGADQPYFAAWIENIELMEAM